jgi:hypothetical protein
MSAMWAICLALISSGCAVRHVRGEVVIPNGCITEMHATENTLCHGPDGIHIKCENVSLTRKAGCERFAVKKLRRK